MELLRWLKVAFLFCLLAVSGGRELKVKHAGDVAVYNHTLATILVEYASAVYMSDLTALITWTCERCSDMIEGFEIIELIVDVQYCLQAFVGVAQDPNAIIIAFRGTQEHSIQNWIEDLFWKQLDINYPGMSDAMVHHGFYSAYHNTTIRSGVLHAVKKTKKFYGDLDIIVTGHSMGGAIASFCALDLTVNHGAQDVQLMTFGQPRIGNSAFASYFSKHVPNAFRVTNEHDMVPHLPPYYSYFPQKTYHHFPREVWLHHIGLGSLVYTLEKVCDSSGEDPSCSRHASLISSPCFHHAMSLWALMCCLL
ncbi:lipase-like isoform X2 [Magnolia sinica]|uniref:lipase-like isoform X2 n=1 Tax=Magnolia sinica TaxID=86752 RepID=UPI002659C115|nr:lipase-like isoform X2 [Magnolia sinica]